MQRSSDTALRMALGAHKAIHAQESEARDKAEAGMNHRLEAMNEFRDQLRDQQATFVRLQQHDDLADRVTRLEARSERSAGRTLGQGAVVAAIVGTIAFIALVLGAIATAARLL